ncbi:MAG: methionine--tRNA ligase [Candidatus Caldatribacteriota bacterium]|nr:methionine--tRNA ligase [Candidatus Caldatribacteriota bacterium]
MSKNKLSKETFYITTPIYYVNDVPHIGHAYTTIAADVLARYKRLSGYDVVFSTGTDEHGQKIAQSAEKAQVTPKQLTDNVVLKFKNLWPLLNIKYDDFIRTTEKRHIKVVQELFNKLYEQGDIYKGEYEGWYCVPCETFWTETQLTDNTCPTCGRKIEKIKEEGYFFKMSKYEKQLLSFIEKNPKCIQPEVRKNEIVSFIKSGLRDQSITRTKKSLQWGIDVPFDHNHVIYVWYDALINYLTVAGYSEDEDKFKKYWPADIHLVGKDIIRFHTIIWFTMLMAAEVKPPGMVFAHGWWTIEGEKMSKSKGNVVDPYKMAEEFGADAFRYFLMREVSFGQDGNFSKDLLIRRINFDLANDLGNLVSRTIAMISQYFDKVIPNTTTEKEKYDIELIELAENTVQEYNLQMNKLSLNMALETIWQFIRRTNKYIDQTKPWVLGKDESKKNRLSNILYNLAESIRLITILIYPFMPVKAKEIWRQLGIKTDLEKVSFQKNMIWGQLKPETLVKPGKVIFPRIDKKEKTKEKNIAKSRPKKSQKEIISYEDFQKLDLRIAKVISAEDVKGTDRLLKLNLKIGEEERTIVAGIKEHYSAKEIIGKKIVVVYNLQPVKLRGIESNGMLLAAADNEKVVLLTVEKDISEGSIIR